MKRTSMNLYDPADDYLRAATVNPDVRLPDASRGCDYRDIVHARLLR